MSLPAILPVGFVSIYGFGYNIGNVGIGVPSSFLFGRVDQIWDGGNAVIQVGSSVLFKASDVVCVLAYSNWNYTIIEQAKLVLTEQLPP